MKISDIGKLIRSRGGITEFPTRVYHGGNLIWERLNQVEPVPPTGILRARYDATDSQTITTGPYQGGSVVQGWSSKEPSGSGLNTTLAQSNDARSPKLVSGAQGINSMQAVKFDGVDTHAATPAFPEQHPQCDNFKRDWLGSITLPGSVESGLYVRYFPWNERFTTTSNNTLGTHPDVVRYPTGIAEYWMVNPTVIGFNRVGASPPGSSGQSNWQPVQLHDGTDPNLYKLDEVWKTARINDWTDQPPAQDTYYLENRGWYFGSGVLVNQHQGDLLITQDSPLLTTSGQQELLDGITVIVLFRNDADPDPYSIEQKGDGTTNDTPYVDHIDGRGSLWFHKHPHINTHAPWEGQLYFDYRDSGNDRIQSGLNTGYNKLGINYNDIAPTQPKILVYQINNVTKKMTVHYDGELYIEGTMNQTHDHITIQSTADFRLANAGWSQAVTIGEVLVFQNAIDEKTRAVNEGYLAHKWGIDDKLPSWHQYKSAQPTQQLVESSWTKIGFTSE